MTVPKKKVIRQKYAQILARELLDEVNLILNQQGEKLPRNCTLSIQRKTVNGKTRLTVGVETIPSSDA